MSAAGLKTPLSPAPVRAPTHSHLTPAQQSPQVPNAPVQDADAPARASFDSSESVHTNETFGIVAQRIDATLGDVSHRLNHHITTTNAKLNELDGKMDKMGERFQKVDEQLAELKGSVDAILKELRKPQGQSVPSSDHAPAPPFSSTRSSPRTPDATPASTPLSNAPSLSDSPSPPDEPSRSPLQLPFGESVLPPRETSEGSSSAGGNHPPQYLAVPSGPTHDRDDKSTKSSRSGLGIVASAKDLLHSFRRSTSKTLEDLEQRLIAVEDALRKLSHN